MSDSSSRGPLFQGLDSILVMASCQFPKNLYIARHCIPLLRIDRPQGKRAIDPRVNRLVSRYLRSFFLVRNSCLIHLIKDFLSADGILHRFTGVSSVLTPSLNRVCGCTCDEASGGIPLRHSAVIVAQASRRVMVSGC